MAPAISASMCQCHEHAARGQSLLREKRKQEKLAEHTTFRESLEIFHDAFVKFTFAYNASFMALRKHIRHLRRKSREGEGGRDLLASCLLLCSAALPASIFGLASRVLGFLLLWWRIHLPKLILLIPAEGVESDKARRGGRPCEPRLEPARPRGPEDTDNWRWRYCCSQGFRNVL